MKRYEDTEANCLVCDRLAPRRNRNRLLVLARFAGSDHFQIVDFAVRAAEEAEWLALLRLNETNNAIQQLERKMGIGIHTLAQWDEEMDERTRRARDRFLVPAKVYYQSYPPQGDEATLIESFLAEIPGRSPDSVCKSGICRLDDLRQGVSSELSDSPDK